MIGKFFKPINNYIRYYGSGSNNMAKDILKDKFNRNHNYLRISLTERCNLRCQYCMPEEGVLLQQKEKILTSEEIVRISKLFVSVGVNKIRFTGGEPLVRPDVESIIEQVGKIKGLEKIAMTTNGILLPRKLEKLQQLGLNHLNISLDTLDSDKFTKITRRLGWTRVWQSITMALDCGLSPVKINCVVMRGVNDEEICDFVELTRDKDLEVRFIEYMPFDGNNWKDNKMITYQEMLGRIQEKFGGVQREKELDDMQNNTSKTYSIKGFKGKIGFITSMSDHFCNTCNRLRITADGNLKVCLFGNEEVSLRDKMRQGSTDEELLEIINQAVLNKRESHADLYLYYKGLKFNQQKKDKQFSFIRNYCTSNNNDDCKITHINESTMMPTMVDVSNKLNSKRTAHARSIIEFPNSIILNELLLSNSKEIQSKKGPVFATSIIAGTMAVKSTHNLIPFCHPLPIESCNIDISILDDKTVQVDCKVSINHKTGVEMEALTGCSIASLTIYDMLKALSKEIIIKEIKLISKTGGKSDFNGSNKN